MAKRGRPKKPETHFKELIDDLIPVNDMFDSEEIILFRKLFNTYKSDFSESDLSANDIDDIITLSTNKVLEFRLLTKSKSNNVSVINDLDKLRKHSEKIKVGLASRRKDRVDPKKSGGISIIDLAANFDNKSRESKINKAKQLLDEESIISNSELLVGNKNDQDSKPV